MDEGSKPDYDLVIEPREGHLYASVTARSMDLQNAIAYGDEIGRAVSSSGLKNILLIRGHPDLEDLREARVAALFFRNALCSGVRLAIVFDHGASHLERLQMARVATDAGINARVYRDEGPALRWLLDPGEFALA